MKTEKSFTDVSIKTGIRMAGYGLLAMFVTALLDSLFADPNLIVWSNAEETFNNLKESAFSYRLHIFFFMLIFILDIIVALGLYLLLKPVNKSISLLAGWFRVMYAAMIGAITINQFNVLYLINGATEWSAYEPSQLHAMVLLSLNAFDDGFSYALIFFSFHILILAYLVYRSGYLPKILGIFLFVAFFGYLVDGLANLLSPGFQAQNKALLAWFLGIAGIIGELFLTLYIVFKEKTIAGAIVQRGID